MPCCLTCMRRRERCCLRLKKTSELFRWNARAYGRPVIAYAKGGSLETIRGIETAEPTGLFF